MPAALTKSALLSQRGLADAQGRGMPDLIRGRRRGYGPLIAWLPGVRPCWFDSWPPWWRLYGRNEYVLPSMWGYTDFIDDYYDPYWYTDLMASLLLRSGRNSRTRTRLAPPTRQRPVLLGVGGVCFFLVWFLFGGIFFCLCFFFWLLGRGCFWFRVVGCALFDLVCFLFVCFGIL